GLIFVNAGPDGCAYVSNGDRVERIAAADGTCSFGTSSAAPSLSLAPGAAMPAQGTSQLLTATFRNVTAATPTPVLFLVVGTNPPVGLGRTDSHGIATFSYTGKLAGGDRVAASATVSATPYASNTAHVTWHSGKHATLADLNPSPEGGLVGALATLKA